MYSVKGQTIFWAHVLKMLTEKHFTDLHLTKEKKFPSLNFDLTILHLIICENTNS